MSEGKFNVRQMLETLEKTATNESVSNLCKEMLNKQLYEDTGIFDFVNGVHNTQSEIYKCIESLDASKNNNVIDLFAERCFDYQCMLWLRVYFFSCVFQQKKTIKHSKKTINIKHK